LIRQKDKQTVQGSGRRFTLQPTEPKFRPMDRTETPEVLAVVLLPTAQERRRRETMLALLCVLGAVPSSAKHQRGACALADFTLKKVGVGGRRELRRILKNSGWEF
jgi:hypothetical protein